MFETPAKDPFSMPWWSDSFESSPPRLSSVPRVNNLSRLNVEPDDKQQSDIDFASTTLPWISREDHTSRNSVNRASIQNASAQGRSARFGGIPESPKNGFGYPPESPARRGESVRRLRTLSMDFDAPEIPSSVTPNRRLRSAAPPKGGSATVPKNDHAVVREASAIRRVLAAREQRSHAKSTVQPITKESAAVMSMDSPESERVVVSYLAEETERIIKGRIEKLKLQSQLNARSNRADQQLQATDHRRSSPREARNGSDTGRHRRHSSHSSLPQVDTTKAETVGKPNMQRDTRSGELVPGLVLESYVRASSRLGSPSLPGSPLPPLHSVASSNGNGVGPNRRISATMESYLENRKTGSNFGPQIVVSGRPDSAVSTAASNPNLAVLREENQSDNPSPSRRYGASRNGSFAEPRAALSPLTGNEDVAHPPTSLPQRKEEDNTSGQGEEVLREGRKDSKEAEPTQRENTSSISGGQYWVDLLGEGQIASTEDRDRTQQTEEQIAISDGWELGANLTPLRFFSNGGREQFPQARTQIDSHSRHPIPVPRVHSRRHEEVGNPVPVPRVHSRRHEEVGSSPLQDRSLGSGSSGDFPTSSRRWRRDTIINSLLTASQENEAPSARNPASLQNGHDDSANAKSLRRLAIDKSASSKDMLPGVNPSLEALIKSDSVKESSEHKQSRRIAVPKVESAGNPLSSCRGYSVSVPEPRRKPKSSFSAPLQIPPPNLQQIDEACHYRVEESSQTKRAGVDYRLNGSKKDGAQVERPKMSHRSSHSLDHDTLKNLFVKTKKDHQRGPSVTTPTSAPKFSKMGSPKTTTKSQPVSPGASFQRWLSNQFKLAPKSRPSSTGGIRQLPEEEQRRKRSPWRRKPAELFQGISRRMGSTTPRSTSLPLFDPNGIPKSPQVSGFDLDFSSHSLSFTTSPGPWHHRVMYAENGSTSPHGTAYVLPSIDTFFPARANSSGNPSIAKDRLPG